MTPGKEPEQPNSGTDEGEVYIEYMRLDGIRRDPTNPKDHDLGALGESFKRFGYVLPMAVNENTDLLMAGHGRLDQLEAMRISGAEPPTRIKTDDRDGMWLAPVIRGIRMSPDDGKAYVIADNRLVELGGWNEPMLVERLIEMYPGLFRLVSRKWMEAGGKQGWDLALRIHTASQLSGWRADMAARKRAGND